MSCFIALVLVLAQQDREIDARIHFAFLHLQASATKEATKLFESAVALDPRHGTARLWLGRLAVDRKDWNSAREHLEIAVTSASHYFSDPVNARFFPGVLDEELGPLTSVSRYSVEAAHAWFFLGLAREGLGDHAGALQAIDNAIGFAPDSVALRMRRAQMAMAHEDLWTALHHYRAASGRKWRGRTRWRAFSNILPDAAPSDAMAATARVARLMDAPELARCAAKAAVEWAPANASFHYLVAVAAEQQGDLEKGIVFANRAIELGFENADVYITIGKLHHHAMHWSRAIAAFAKGFALQPEAIENIPSFPLDSLTTSEYIALRDLLERHAAYEPDSLGTLYSLGTMLLREGELARSQELFERLTSLAPDDAAAQHNLALTYVRQGRREDGASAMDRFRELKAREDEVREQQRRRAQRWAMLGALRDDNRHAEAVTIGLELTDGGPADADQLVTLADSLLELGRRSKSRFLVERALEESPYDRGGLTLAAVLGDRSAFDRLALLDPRCR